MSDDSKNGTGPHHHHNVSRIDASRPQKARRAARRAMRDALLSKQIEGLGGEHGQILEAIVQRLDSIDARVGRLEVRLIGLGGVAFLAFEVAKYFIERAQ